MALDGLPNGYLDLPMSKPTASTGFGEREIGCRGGKKWVGARQSSATPDHFLRVPHVVFEDVSRHGA
jgi:hypothetical protein